MTNTVHFSKAWPLVLDFQLIPQTPLDFQVALNVGDTAPLSGSYYAFVDDVKIIPVCHGIVAQFRPGLVSECRVDIIHFMDVT